MTLHEGLAQAVSTKGPSKEGWIQAEPWGREGGHFMFMHLHKGASKMTGTFTQRMPRKEVYTGDYRVNQKVETTVLGLQAKECQRLPILVLNWLIT